LGWQWKEGSPLNDTPKGWKMILEEPTKAMKASKAGIIDLDAIIFP
jgi:hypothetical protein